MESTTILLTILGMGVVTYLPRILPAWFLRGRELPPFLVAWLRYVPVAILAALLLPSLVVQNGQLSLGVNNLYIWAAIPAVFVAWKKRSLFLTVVAGMGVVILARLLFGL